MPRFRVYYEYVTRGEVVVEAANKEHAQNIVEISDETEYLTEHVEDFTVFLVKEDNND